MKIKNGDLEGLLEGFTKLKELTGFKFVIALNRNKELIESELNIISQIRKESDEIVKLKEEFQAKQILYADKDEDGNPKLEVATMADGSHGQRIVMSADSQKKLSKELDKFNKDNKDVIKKQNDKDIEYIKALSEDTAIKFHIIDEDDVPTDISVEQFEVIDFMVNLK